MSSFYEDASLVMIPSGYKTSKVYSAKPTDGAGDLTFSRSNDTATRVNSAGLIEKVRTNLILQSNSFSDAAWVKLGAGTGTAPVLTANYTTDPFGGNNAWRFQCDLNGGTASGDRSWIYQTFAGSPSNGTLSIYVKLNSAGSVNLVFSDGAGDTQTVTSTTWVRLNIPSAAIGEFRLGLIGYNGTDTCDLSIAFSQVEAGDIATDYIATTSAAVSVGPVANVPRLDYLGSSCPRLLLEPQRTNSLTYSEQLNNAAWTSLDNVSVSANVSTTLDPSGYYGADKLVENTANTQHRIYRVFTGTGSTFSFFAKAAERSWVSVLSNDGNFSFFNIANGTLGTIAATSTATITPYGNGWYRCTLYNTHGNFGALIQLTTANNVTSYLGDGTSGAFIWGCQFESSVTYATSYIPTLGASVTRGTEQYDKVITSLVPDATTFTWEVDFIVPEFASGGGEIFGRNVAGTAQLRLYANNNTVIRFRVESGAQNYDTAVSVGDTAKCIFRCSSGVVSAFYNGVKIHTFTGVSMDFGKIQFGPPVTSPKIIRSLVFPTALTDAQCIELTA
jgi:hypothetical protein